MRWLVLVLMTLQTATCGQKGPLTLPQPERAPQPAKAEVITPAALPTAES